jgi:hypothetical protein
MIRVYFTSKNGDGYVFHRDYQYFSEVIIHTELFAPDVVITFAEVTPEKKEGEK